MGTTFSLVKLASSPGLLLGLEQVEQYHNVIFHGPEGSLQDYIAHQLALCMKVLCIFKRFHFLEDWEEYRVDVPALSSQHRQMAAGFPCEIVRAEVDPGFSKEQLVDVFISSGKAFQRAGVIFAEPFWGNLYSRDAFSFLPVD